MRAFEMLMGMGLDYATGSAAELVLNARGDPAALREAARRLTAAADRLEPPATVGEEDAVAEVTVGEDGTPTVAADVFANARLRAGPYD